MKPFTIFAAIATASAATTPSAPPDTMPAASKPVRNFVQVPLPGPLNWTVGPRLFPHFVIRDKSQHANYTDYNRDSWAAHVLDECKKVERCTSTFSFSALNLQRVRTWIGYLFIGGPTNQYDYLNVDPRRRDAVQGSVAYTVVNPPREKGSFWERLDGFCYHARTVPSLSYICI